MIPGKHTFDTTVGDLFETVIRYKVNGEYMVLPSGAAVRGQLRKAKGDADPAAATYTCTVLDQDMIPGGVMLKMAPSVTATLSGRYVYDIELTKTPGDVKTWLEGEHNFNGDVTR